MTIRQNIQVVVTVRFEKYFDLQSILRFKYHYGVVARPINYFSEKRVYNILDRLELSGGVVRDDEVLTYRNIYLCSFNVSVSRQVF